MIWGRGHHGCESLRGWFRHDPAKWVEFKKRYFAELDRRAKSGQPLREAALRGTIILVFGARDVRHNQAVAPKEYLESKIRPQHQG